MPHLIVEYSNNIKQLDSEELLMGLNQHLIQTGLVSAKDLKSRAYANTEFLVGLGDQQQAYIHVHLYLMQGRSSAEKKLLADQSFAALSRFKNYQAHGLEVQLTLQISEMQLDDYRKATLQL